jgi:hypothetical protein
LVRVDFIIERDKVESQACRNGWIFENIPPTVEGCGRFLREELKLLLFRVRPHIAEDLVTWMQSAHL